MKTSRAVRLLVGTVVLALAFGSACLAIRPLFPFRQIANVHAKLMHFRAHANDYDTLFIGSSRMNYQVIPARFDQLSQAAGLPTNSYNAGVAGMRPPEDTYFLDQLLAARPQGLRWVFIELGNLRPRMNDDLRGTVRAQYWHDWPRLCLIWQRLSQLKPSKKTRPIGRVWRELREPLAEFPEHLDLFLREMSNLGRGDFLARQLVEDPPDWQNSLASYLGSDLAGWIPARGGESMTAAVQSNFEEERAERLAHPAVHDPGDPVSQAALEAMVEKVELLGATPVLIVTPVTAKKVFYPRPERAARTMVLDLNDPARFPELYENRHRRDTDHLNTAGAEVFTRLLAEQWTAAVKAAAAGR